MFGRDLTGIDTINGINSVAEDHNMAVDSKSELINSEQYDDDLYMGDFMANRAETTYRKTQNDIIQDGAIVVMKCPSCGVIQQYNSNRDNVFCTSCGFNLLKNNPSPKIFRSQQQIDQRTLYQSESKNEQIYRNIDEAKLYRAETERIMQDRKSMQRLSAGAILGIIFLAVGFLIVLITVIINNVSKTSNTTLITVMGFGVFACGIMIFYKLRKIDRD